MPSQQSAVARVALRRLAFGMWTSVMQGNRRVLSVNFSGSTMSAAALATADLIAAARAPAAIDAGRIAHLVGRAAVGQTDRIVTKGVTGRRELMGRRGPSADASVEPVVATHAHRVLVEQVGF